MLTRPEIITNCTFICSVTQPIVGITPYNCLFVRVRCYIAHVFRQFDCFTVSMSLFAYSLDSPAHLIRTGSPERSFIRFSADLSVILKEVHSHRANIRTLYFKVGHDYLLSNPYPPCLIPCPSHYHAASK